MEEREHACDVRSMGEGEDGRYECHGGVRQGEQEDDTVEHTRLAQCPDTVREVHLDRCSSTEDNALQQANQREIRDGHVHCKE